MSMINLLPLAEQQKRKIDTLNYYTLTGGMITVVGVIILAGMLLVFDQVYNVTLDNVKSQKTQAEAQVALYLDVEKKSQDLQQQLTSVKKAEGETTHWTNLLTELQGLTPPNVSIDSFTVGEATKDKGAAKTDLAGKADSRRSLGQFQIALSGSPYIKSVDIQSTTLAGNAIDYKLSLELNYDKLNGPGK